MFTVATDEAARQEGRSILDEICREGARRLLAAALGLEVELHIAALTAEAGDSIPPESGKTRTERVGQRAGRPKVNLPGFG